MFEKVIDTVIEFQYHAIKMLLVNVPYDAVAPTIFLWLYWPLIKLINFFFKIDDLRLFSWNKMKRRRFNSKRQSRLLIFYFDPYLYFLHRFTRKPSVLKPSPRCLRSEVLFFTAIITRFRQCPDTISYLPRNRDLREYAALVLPLDTSLSITLYQY